VTVLFHLIDKPIPGATAEDVPDVRILVERVRHGEATAVVLGARVERPVRLAQRLRAIDEGLPIAVLAPKDRFARVERAVAGAPIAGPPVRCFRADDSAAILAHLGSLPSSPGREPRSDQTAGGSRARASGDRVSPAQVLDGILDGPTAVAIVDTAGVLVSANQRTCDLLGVDEHQALGFSLEKLLPPEAWQTTKDVLETHATKTITLPQADGTARDLEVHAPTPALPHGVAAVLVFVDVSHRREAAEALARKDKLQLDLLNMISHDIRAPLGVVVGAINELGNDDVGVLNDEQKFLLNLVRKSVERLTRLASNIVYLGRMEAGRAEITRRKTDLRVVVKHVSDELQRIDAGSTIVITQDLPDAPLEANVDSERIAQVLVNLLSNAVKFAKKEVRVTLRTAPDAGPGSQERGSQERDVEIEVADDGSGIPEKAIASIFERFSRVDAPRSGTGLGLAIVRGIVQAHGGSVRAVNLKSLDPKQSGARLTVRFPRQV
jgi:PAS domain S-box-containing protein